MPLAWSFEDSGIRDRGQLDPVNALELPTGLLDVVPEYSSNVAAGLQQTTSDAQVERVDNGIDATGSREPPEEPSQAAQKCPQTIREFEAAMRALGFSKRQAATIASSGFKALGKRAEGADESDLLAELVNALTRRGQAFELRITHHGTTARDQEAR